MATGDVATGYKNVIGIVRGTVHVAKVTVDNMVTVNENVYASLQGY